MDINKEREAFLKWHYQAYLLENPEIDMQNAQYIYDYAHKNALSAQLRESQFTVWQAAKAQAEKSLLEQFEINAKLTEKIVSMVTYDRLQELIAIGVKSALDEREKRVMDLQKEREAFEQHLTDTGLVEFSDYGFAVDECDEYLHEPTQVAWDSWLIGLNRAKAQAVPEGFVLVPKEPTEKMNKAGLQEYRKVIGVGQDDIGYIYKAMIEAQEQANDS